MNPSSLITEFVNRLERKEVASAMELVSAECEYDNVPMSKVFGPDAIAAMLGPMLSQCSEVEWIVHRQAAQGNVVFNERVDRFHMPFGWLEIPVTGVFEVHDEKITLWRDYFDLATYRNQLPKKD
jgi:limonene-1,2-epoxide hydrolase